MPADDEMLPEYDFSGAVRRRFGLANDDTQVVIHHEDGSETVHTLGELIPDLPKSRRKSATAANASDG